jgi:hypothetical protein
MLGARRSWPGLRRSARPSRRLRPDSRCPPIDRSALGPDPIEDTNIFIGTGVPLVFVEVVSLKPRCRDRSGGEADMARAKRLPRSAGRTSARWADEYDGVFGPPPQARDFKPRTTYVFSLLTQRILGTDSRKRLLDIVSNEHMRLASKTVFVALQIVHTVLLACGPLLLTVHAVACSDHARNAAMRWDPETTKFDWCRHSRDELQIKRPPSSIAANRRATPSPL